MTDNEMQPTVLIVDDHAPAAAMISRIFTMNGFETIILDNGAEVVQIAQSALPDIILLDIMMPLMNGYEVLEELRKSPITHQIPVIFVTAKTTPDDIAQGLGLGADDYIVKPIKPREVLARVQSKLEARKLQDALRQRSTELEALLRFSQELNNQIQSDTLLDLIIYLVLDLIPCDATIIYHLDAEMNITNYKTQIRKSTDEAQINPEMLLNQVVLESFIGWQDTMITGTSYNNGISYHLTHVGQVHGIIVILGNESFSAHTQKLLETIAQQATLALRNTELYETVVHYAQHLEEMVDERTKELRSAEQLLIRSEKLASVGRLAAGIAHEINNPLMPIRMNLEMMQEDIQNQVAVSEEDVTHTLDSVNRISRIVSRLQQFTRGRGEDVPEMQSLRASDVITSVLKLSDTFIRHSGIEVITDLDSDTVIYGNRDQLEQVFLNITLNAQASMPDGGVLKISAKATDETTVIIIEDSGTGIEPDIIEHIFEPFVSTKDDGSGLGLFISHNIIHNHSGQIEVESEVGKGTRFIITLPTLERVSS